MGARQRVMLALLAIVAVVGAVAFAVDTLQRARIGPHHEFLIADPPPFLTESLAMTKAREALALDVADPEVWHVAPDGRTTAPDGRRDEFLSRNGLNPNHGSVRFNGPDAQVRFVSVELRGD